MVETLNIQGTEELPSIYFDTTYKLKIKGCSIPSDAWMIYRDITLILSKLVDKTPGSIDSEFVLNYCNKASLHCICDLLKILRQMEHKGWEIKVKWHYQNDEDIKDSGELFSKILEGSFELVESEEMLEA